MEKTLDELLLAIETGDRSAQIARFLAHQTKLYVQALHASGRFSREQIQARVADDLGEQMPLGEIAEIVEQGADGVIAAAPSRPESVRRPSAD